MLKMSRPIQILLPPWLDEWIVFLAERYNVSKATIIRNHIASGILMWSQCISKEGGCPVINKLTDSSKELQQQIYGGTITPEDLGLITDDLAFEARVAMQLRKKKMK
jgi:hypothetical protein